MIKEKHPTNKQPTLCWSCKKAIGNCSWSDGTFRPVDGWDAEPTIIWSDKKCEYIDSFQVFNCPLYDPDTKESKPKAQVKPLYNARVNTPRWRLLKLGKDRITELLNVLHGRQKILAELSLIYNYSAKDIEEYCGIKHSSISKTLQLAFGKMEAANDNERASVTGVL